MQPWGPTEPTGALCMICRAGSPHRAPSPHCQALQGWCGSGLCSLEPPSLCCGLAALCLPQKSLPIPMSHEFSHESTLGFSVVTEAGEWVSRAGVMDVTPRLRTDVHQLPLLFVAVWWQQNKFLSKLQILNVPVVILLVLVTWTNHLSFVLWFIYFFFQKLLLASWNSLVSHKAQCDCSPLAKDREFGMYRALKKHYLVNPCFVATRKAMKG